MGTLAETAYYMRNFIKFSGIGIVSYIIISQSIGLAYRLYLYYNPPPPPPPTLGFGLLPPINFPDQANYDLMFELETPNAGFPVLEDRGVVYYMPFQRASLLALDEADLTAEMLGFIEDPISLTSEIYQWKMSLPSPLVLEQNISNGSYVYNYQWQTDKGLLTDSNIPGKDETIIEVENYLQKTGLELEDVDHEDAVISYTKASGNRMIPALSISDANFVQVDLFRQPILIGVGDDAVERPVVTPDPEKGIIRMQLSGSILASKRIVGVEYNYYPVNYLEPHTYLLKPVDQAWQELKSGNAFVALNEDDEADIIYIRRIELGYFDSYQAQEYMQPIYIFRGDDGGSDQFIAYIHAINDLHIVQQ